MNGFGGILLPSRADKTSGQNIGAYGKTHEKVDDQVNKRTGGTDRAYGTVVDKLTHDYQVYGIERQLQQTG